MKGRRNESWKPFSVPARASLSPSKGWVSSSPGASPGGWTSNSIPAPSSKGWPWDATSLCAGGPDGVSFPSSATCNWTPSTRSSKKPRPIPPTPSWPASTRAAPSLGASTSHRCWCWKRTPASQSRSRPSPPTLLPSFRPARKRSASSLAGRRSRATFTSATRWRWRASTCRSICAASSSARPACLARRAPARPFSPARCWPGWCGKTWPSTWCSTCTTSTAGRARTNRGRRSRGCGNSFTREYPSLRWMQSRPVAGEARWMAWCASATTRSSRRTWTASPA